MQCPQGSRAKAEEDERLMVGVVWTLGRDAAL